MSFNKQIMETKEITNNCKTNIEESFINNYLNNEGLRIGKEISLKYLKQVIKKNPSIDDYCVLTILEMRIKEIEEKISTLLEELEDYDIQVESINQLKTSIQNQKEIIIKYLTSKEFFLSNCSNIIDKLKGEEQLKSYKSSIYEILKNKPITEIERIELSNNISKKVHSIYCDKDHFIRNMSCELDKDYIMKIISTKLIDFEEKDEKEIENSIIKMLYHFVYEITINNVKTIQFILNNESIKKHKTNK